MNWVDAAIILVFIYYIIDGYRRGFFELFLELLTFVVAMFVALNLDMWAGEILAAKINMPPTFRRPAGFMAVWFAVQLILSLILRLGYRFIPKNLKKSVANRTLGIPPSLAKGIILLAVILTLVMALPISGGLKDDVSKSLVGGQIAGRSVVLDNFFKQIFGSNLSELTTFLTVKPPRDQILEPDERVNLGFKVTSGEVDEASEEKMLALVNEERQAAGLSTLKADPEMQAVARAHAVDMFAKGYFSHINLEGKTPFDRMKEAGVEFKTAGENLALAPNVDMAHNGLMNSPGHRANILEPQFGRAGIGVIDGGIYGKMFVQNFRN